MSRYITLLVVVAASLCLANSNFLLADAVTQKIDVDTLKQSDNTFNYKLALNQTLTWNVEGFNLVKAPAAKEANFTEVFNVTNDAFKTEQRLKPGDTANSNFGIYSAALTPKKEGNFTSTFLVTSKNGTEPEKTLDVKVNFEITKSASNAILSIAKLALVVIFAVFCF
jgi:hypothetical protein